MITASINLRQIEPEIRQIGREIFRRAQAAAPSVFSMEHWQQLAMNWLTADESLKRRLFQFIEVLPSLTEPADITRHLDEYLHATEDGDPAQPLPALFDWVLGFRRYDSAHARLVAWAAIFGCGTSAKQFIVGSTPEEAIASVRRLRRHGMTFTLDVLGETIIADRVAAHHQQVYLNLIRHLGRESSEWRDNPILDIAPWGPLRKVNISIKFSAIVARFDPMDPVGTSEAVLDRFRPILRAARDSGCFINVDMEHYAVKDLTFDIFKRVLTEPEFQDWPDCGIVVQTYMPEGEADMRSLISWARRRGTPITVRVVKGAYWDSETANARRNRWPVPLYTEKWQSDASFERVAALLLQNTGVIRPAFASHNVRSIAAVLAMESALGLPPRTLELQMLTGMGDQLKRALVGMNQRLRVYAPFGDMMTGMAYLIRRLIENTANESFLLQGFGKQLPEDQLLDPPGPARNGRTMTASPIEPRPMKDVGSNGHFLRSADIDFSRPTNRDAMQAALDSVRSQFGRKHPAIISNAGVDSRAWHESRNPSNPAEVVGRSAVCDHEMAARAIEAAQLAFGSWSSTPAEKRAAILDRAADLLDARRFELCAWMIFETGKTWREAQAEFMETADFLRCHAAESRRLFGPGRHTTSEKTAQRPPQPRGVTAVITPFCFPMAHMAGMASAALATGNTVVVKPASDASICAAKLCEILIEAGLPSGVLNLTPGQGSDLGEFLAQHHLVRTVAFTGTPAVASRIRSAAAANTGNGEPPCVIAETGGINSIIVDDDANLDEAVQAIIVSAFGYSGQACTACSRAIVLDHVYQAFLSKLLDAASCIRPGPAEDPATTVGPLINAHALESARRMAAIGADEGRLLLPMTSFANGTGGYFASPAIIADVPVNSAFVRQPCMAPILCVHRISSIDNAITVANDVPVILCAGIHSRSPRNIRMARQHLRAGMVYVNRRTVMYQAERLPFEAFRVSGLGGRAVGGGYLLKYVASGIVDHPANMPAMEPARGVPMAHAHEPVG